MSSMYFMASSSVGWSPIDEREARESTADSSDGEPCDHVLHDAPVQAEAGERGQPADREVADQREQLLVAEDAPRPAGVVGADCLAQQRGPGWVGEPLCQR